MQEFIFSGAQIAVLVMSVVIHEVSHGYAAYFLGDSTAKFSGRLTLNPLRHLDPVGSVLIPASLILLNAPLLIGWALPVPYNPANLRGGKWGSAWVAFAGPFSNIAIALGFGLTLRVLTLSSLLSPELLVILTAIVYINIALAIFNLIPIPPLDGSKVLSAFLPGRLYRLGNALERRAGTAGFLILFALLLYFSPYFFGFVADLAARLSGVRL